MLIRVGKLMMSPEQVRSKTLAKNENLHFWGHNSSQSEANKYYFSASDIMLNLENWPIPGGGPMAKNGDGEFGFFIWQIRHFSPIFDFGISHFKTDF